MLRTLSVFAVGLLAFASLFAGSPPSIEAEAPDCAANRADVMTLSDSEAHIIDSGAVLGVRISSLAAFPQPDELPGVDPRFDPYETNIWVTAGKLIKAQTDSSGTITAVVQDFETTDAITIVFPDPSGCARNADPRYQMFMQQARDAFVQAVGMPAEDGSTPVSGDVRVTGVGFLNKLAGNSLTGAGIELAPVLAIEFADTGAPAPATGDAQSAADVPPTPTPKP
jgi:hypothetical protein